MKDHLTPTETEITTRQSNSIAAFSGHPQILETKSLRSRTLDILSLSDSFLQEMTILSGVDGKACHLTMRSQIAQRLMKDFDFKR